MKKSKDTIMLVVVLLISISVGIFLSQKSTTPTVPNQNSKPVACTMEAKQCPDGSYVSRSGPDCEFAKCPDVVQTPTIDTTGWKTSTDTKTGVTFKYPAKLSTTYINASDWPPKVEVANGPFGCMSTGEVNTPTGKTETKTINAHQYCVTRASEGAAGSVYTKYAYSYALQDKVLTITFTLRQPQCDNYDDPQKTACKAEEGTFNVDNLIDSIVQTVTLQ